MTGQPKFWVEARTSVKDATKVIGYGVWHISPEGARECVKRFRVTRKGGWTVALCLAYRLRDQMLHPQLTPPQ